MQPIELHWPGGQHEFALPLGQLRALQDACNAGPEEIFNRIRLGTWRVDDLMGIIRFGLIGGGMDRNEAARLVSNMFDAHGAVEFKLVSLGILQHALFGPDDDTPGKDEGVETETLESGSSPESTETEPS